MRIYAVTAHNRDPGPGGYRSTWVYSEFFHGRNDGGVSRYGHPPYTPPRLVRNVRIMPRVFFSSISMIVDEGVAAELRQFNNVDLNLCVWGKVYDWPTDEEHVRELYERFSPILEDPYNEWFEQQLRDPGPDIQAIKYFEVLAPLAAKIQDGCTSPSQFVLPSPAYEKLPPLLTCAERHEKYPIVKYTPYYICTEPVYRILQPHVSDPHQFRVYHHDL